MASIVRGDAGSLVLTAGVVAQRLGVAVSTLRTWDRRYGLGATGHQAGRHRRYTAADLLRLERMRRLTFEGVPPAVAARLVREPPAPATATGGSAGGPRPTGA
jgi:DNA-binding transcriptional MerR regulator